MVTRSFSHPNARIPALLLLVAVLTVSVEAYAQDMTFPGSIDIELRIPDEDEGNEPFPPNDQQRLEFFNRARCVCGEQFTVRLTLVEQAGQIVPNVPAEVWVGTNCADDELRPQQCQQITVFDDVETMRDPKDVPVPIINLVSPATPTNPLPLCPLAQRNNSLYVLVDVNQNNTNYASFNLQIPVDTEPPPEPTDISVFGAEKAVSASWDLPDNRADDIFFYQLLCARADGSVDANDDIGGDAKYETSQERCEANLDGAIPPRPPVTPVTGSTPGGIFPGQLEILAESTICATSTGSQLSARAGGLQNGIDYRVVLLMADQSLNPTALDLGVVRPQPAIDFWEDYRRNGGTAEGGFGCAVSGAEGGAATGILLVIALALISGRRRRRAIVGAGAVAMLIASSSPATAQPYYEEEPDEQVEAGPAIPHWNIGIKVGPYYPDVDKDFSGEGPFERMYGDKMFILPQVDLDRFFLYPLGQLGVTASVGFTTRGANAFQDDGNGNPVLDAMGNPIRTEGDKTSFRLVPISVGVVYRFTELDDRWGIPLVPYGKAGLAYYIWWATSPGGGVSEASTDPNCNPDVMACNTTDALGASFGFQATAGLALRAERVDPSAERALRNELGIEHAGIYAEMLYANVDGFGSSSKLAVGDLTFFGGINFEF